MDKPISAYRWAMLSKDEQDAALAAGMLPPMAGGSSKTYAVYNGPMPTTAALTPVTTGAAVKTMLQIATPASGQGLRVIEWGISFDAIATTPVRCELIDTAAINATVTAFVANDIHRMNGPNDAGSVVALGTAASGYTATAEGTTVASRLGDYQLVQQSYLKQFPLGREFEVGVSRFLRVRVTAATAVNAVAYIVWEE